jgi:hypothetical protein
MSDVQTELASLVSEFVAKVTELSRRAAVDTLHAALAAGMSGASAPAAARGAKVGRPRTERADRPVGAERGKGAKRPPAELAKLQERVHEFIASNPGLRIEQINKELSTSTRDLALPLRKLIADGEIHTKGEKRATTYFPGEGGKARRKKG